MELPTDIISAALASIVLYGVFVYGNRWYSRKCLSRLHNCQPCSSYPHKDRILGTDFHRATIEGMMSGSFLKFRQGLYSRSGKTYTANFWLENQIHTMDLKNMQTIFALDFHKYGVEPTRIPTSGDWLGRGIFTTDGPFWRHSRDMVKPIFARAQISNLSSFAKHIDSLFDLIPTDGTEVDLQPLFLRLYLDHSTEFLFGESANTLHEASSTMDAETFIKRFDDALRGCGKRHALGKWLSFFVRKDPQFLADCRESQIFVEKCVEKAIARRAERTSGEKKFIFVDELLDQSHDRKYLRDQLLNMFFPARDSSAIGISLIFFQVARQPEVWKKLREEVKENKEELSFERLKSMKYLQAVLNESLRLAAPAGAALRTCLEDAVLPHGGGPAGDAPILVTRGTNIRTDWDLMQRDPDIWGADAEEFRPERWTEIRPQWEYMPFMGGPRICPAQQWILTQYAYILARFAEKFEIIQNRDPVEELIEEIRMTKQSRNGVKVACIKA